MMLREKHTRESQLRDLRNQAKLDLDFLIGL